MAVLVTPTNVQKLEFDVTTAEGPSRVTIVTGIISYFEWVSSQSPQAVQKTLSLKTLLMLSLAPGQFRKATAIASIARTYHGAGDPAAATVFNCSIDEVEATLDDESGNVELRVDLSASASGNQTTTITPTISFQVTTLSKL